MSVSSMPEHFKEIADSYDDLREFNQGLIESMKNKLDGESRTLDLASGTGRYCNELSENSFVEKQGLCILNSGGEE